MFESLKNKLSESSTWKWIAVSAAAVGVVYYVSRSYQAPIREEPKPHSQISLSSLEAFQRASSVREVDYRLHIEINPELFKGTLLLTFKCEGSTQTTWLDYANSSVKSVTINGIPQEQIQWSQGRIYLEGLRESNEVEVEFVGVYEEKVGVVRYKDPIDGTEYISTNLKNFHANRLFPCFDQLDIKAKLQLSVDVPEDWVVIGNEPSTDSGESRLGRKNYEFKQAQTISPNAVALCAGQFASIKLPSNKTNVQLSFYCRRSQAAALEACKLRYFSLAVQSLLSFQDVLALPFQFTKYDHIFVPNMQTQSEDSTGCVFLNEELMLQHPNDDVQFYKLYDFVLHGMACQWLGNLVSPKWWGDMWLFEAIARRISCEVKLKLSDLQTNTQESKVVSNLTTSSQPFDLVNDTEHIQDFYEQVRLGCGEAQFAKMMKDVEDEVFITAVQNFLKKFEFGCANIEDFLRIVSDLTGR